MNEVFVLCHTYGSTDEEEDKNWKQLGIYSSYEEAEKAKTRAVKQPGFSDYPDGFIINRYTLNKDKWAEGFRTDNCVDIPAWI